MSPLPRLPRRRSTGRRARARGLATGLVLACAMGGGWAAADGPGPATPSAPRARTDVPREVPAVPPVSAPDPRHGGPPVSPEDLAAARDVVWPLPPECTSPDTTEPRGSLPRQGGYSTDPGSVGPGARLRRVLAPREGQLVGIDGAGPPSRCDRLRWRLVAAAVPAEHLDHLDQLVLYDYPQHVLADPARSGGVRTGFFEPSPADPTRFRVALATDLSDREQLVTLAHEVGHVVSLYADRPRPRRTPDCPWVIDDVGTCAAAGSPLVDFYAATYPPSTRAQVAGLYRDRRSPGKDELAAFYREHAHEFVSAYAATHPTEDFAESYAHWCLYGLSAAAPVEGPPDAGLAKRAFFDRLVQQGRLSRKPCSVLRGLAARP